MDLSEYFDGINLPNSTLAEGTSKEIISKEVEEEIDLANTDDWSVGITPSLAGSVCLYNNTTIPADDEVLMKLNYADVVHTSGILAYTITGRVAPSVSFTSGNFDFGIKANQALSFSYYSVHDKTSSLMGAVIDDVTHFKNILSLKSIKNLSDNSALTASLNGSLEGSVSVSLSDTLSASLKEISKVLSLSDVLQLKIASGADLKCTYKIEDSFEILIQKKQDEYFVALSKSLTQKGTVDASLKVGVSFDNPELITEALDAFISDKVTQLVEVTTGLLDKLPENYTDFDFKKLLDIADKLGIDVPDTVKSFENIEAVKGLIADKVADAHELLEEKLIDDIKGVLKSTLELGVGYSYSYTKTEETLLSATFTEAALESQHKNIIRLRANKILEASEVDNTAIALIEYKKITATEILKSLKIGLTIGDFGLSQTDTRKVTKSEHHLYKDDVIQKKVTDLSYVRTAKLVLFGPEAECSFAFNTEMPKYIPHNDRFVTNMFSYGITISANYKDGKKLTRHEFKEFLDFAVCWGILPEDKFESTYNELIQEVKGEKGVSFELLLKVPSRPLVTEEGNFDSLLETILGLNINEKALILAQCLPYIKAFYGRRNLTQKEEVYVPFFRYYLTDAVEGNLSDYEIEEKLGDSFNNNDNVSRHLLSYEKDHTRNESRLSFLLSSDNMYEELKELTDTFQLVKDRLDRYIEEKGTLGSNTFKRSLFASFNLKHVYEVRILGAIFAYAAKKAGIMNEVTTSMTIKVPEEDDILLSSYEKETE
ncbi:hypothetical protein NBRC110019_16010 [Neptunitalea chrysea]|uniref:Uncharacterized protein n=1 Tax=Neptunitalea chrysea TaxID=1647581 RepID=A0A9W6B4G2_9FLAO|nr:hypothetical protein [Neptunitalea chrysea]GLB52561.1 hypothetical protein NBRC110019_16010 [Neptunitalea chrysea]